ncbi:conserved hypothetical protein [Flavobacterium sp. 9AF]|uniref:DUF6896 domain-containing protein n=1 Tax=Flavobacterium sp. 9AF TaxID=2653142 RepID=UPI0012F41B2F|nr:hypothetical protein [Flavobacterium sp. 9AF]VXB76811.1 conserved hypothetical protein [Flavobacterium sp. 9AF]
MKRTTHIININSVEEVPTLERIRLIPREQKMKLVFEKEVQNQRKTIGQNLKKELVGFLIGIHTIEPEINIAKLITDKEIEDHQVFFEQCAKDYRQLSEELLYKLVNKLKLKLNKDFPMETFNELKQDERQMGKLENWRYFVHGFHCGFKNEKTGQAIEVPLVFGQEFGDLDPYFFSKFIKSTPKYKPLPISIFEDYDDGKRINEKMLSLGKFERISSNVGNHYGIVVTDRQKVAIKSYLELEKMYEEQNKQIEKPKFDFWKFMRLKK